MAFCLAQIPALCEENAPQLFPSEQAEIEQNADNGTDFAEESSVTTTPMTGEIDAMVSKSPYENNFQENTPKQNEFTRAVFMFLKTMLAVGICSVIIFLLLLFVRKFYGTMPNKTPDETKVENNLKSTQNENEALQIFFKKTKNL